MLKKEEKRILDANRNRITEALRVVEDLLRFQKGTARFALRVKKIRHKIFPVFEEIEKELGEKLIFYRDSLHDRGRRDDYDKAGERQRSAFPPIVRRNLRRACEGLRVCEEVTGNLPYQTVFAAFKSLRFSIYDLEKELELIWEKKANSSSKK